MLLTFQAFTDDLKLKLVFTDESKLTLNLFSRFAKWKEKKGGREEEREKKRGTSFLHSVYCPPVAAVPSG